MSADEFSRLMASLGGSSRGANTKLTPLGRPVGGMGQMPQMPQMPQWSPQLAEQYRLASQERNAAWNTQNDWDPVWRPIEHGLNILTALGSGVQNAIDKSAERGVDIAEKAISGDWGGALLDGAAEIVPWNTLRSAWDGVAASATNDTKSENYMYGAKLIENMTDRLGRADPRYENVDDNVNPWVKGIGGFALDVGLDPVTYVSSGILSAGARGIGAAGKALKMAQAGNEFGMTPIRTGLNARLAGIKYGAAAVVPEGATGYRYGRSGRIKPQGLNEWRMMRDYDAVQRIGRKTGLSQAQMNNLARAGQRLNRNAVVAQMLKTLSERLGRPATMADLQKIQGKLGVGAAGARRFASAQRVARIYERRASTRPLRTAGETRYGPRPTARQQAAAQAASENPAAATQAAAQAANDIPRSQPAPAETAAQATAPGAAGAAAATGANLVEAAAREAEQAAATPRPRGKKAAREERARIAEIARLRGEQQRINVQFARDKNMTQAEAQAAIAALEQQIQALQRQGRVVMPEEGVAARGTDWDGIPRDTLEGGDKDLLKEVKLDSETGGRGLRPEGEQRVIPASEARAAFDEVLQNGEKAIQAALRNVTVRDSSGTVAKVSIVDSEVAERTVRYIDESNAGNDMVPFVMPKTKKRTLKEEELDDDAAAAEVRRILETRQTRESTSGEYDPNMIGLNADIVIRGEDTIGGANWADNVEVQTWIDNFVNQVFGNANNLPADIHAKMFDALLYTGGNIREAMKVMGLIKVTRNIEGAAPEILRLGQMRRRMELREMFEMLGDIPRLREMGIEFDEGDLMAIARALDPEGAAKITGFDDLAEQFFRGGANSRAAKLYDRAQQEVLKVADVVSDQTLFRGDDIARAADEIDAAAAVAKIDQQVAEEIAVRTKAVGPTGEIEEIIPGMAQLVDDAAQEGFVEYAKRAARADGPDAVKNASKPGTPDSSVIPRTNTDPSVSVSGPKKKFDAIFDRVPNQHALLTGWARIRQIIEDRIPLGGRVYREGVEPDPRTPAKIKQDEENWARYLKLKKSDPEQAEKFRLENKLVEPSARKVSQRGLRAVTGGNTIAQYRAAELSLRRMVADALQVGVVFVTHMPKTGNRIFRSGANKGQFDAAFINLVDVLDVIGERLGHALLFGIRIGNKSDVSFPPTLLQEVSLIAMKMRAAGYDEVTIRGAMWARTREFLRGSKNTDFRDYAKLLGLDGKDGLEQIAKGVDPASAAHAVDSAFARIASREGQEMLMQRHVAAGAIATKLASDQADVIAAPIKAALDDVVRDVLLPMSERIVALPNSIKALREAIRKAGLSLDSFDGRIALSRFQRYAAQLSDPFTVATTRHAKHVEDMQRRYPSSGEKISDEAAEKIQQEVADAWEAGTPIKPTKTQKEAVRKAGTASPAANTARRQEAATADQTASQAVLETMTNSTEDVAAAAARVGKTEPELAEAAMHAAQAHADHAVDIHTAVTLGRWEKFAAAMEGSYRQGDIRAYETAEQVNAQNLTARIERVLEDVAQRLGLEEMTAWALKFANAKSNRAISKMINEITDEGHRANVALFWKAFSQIHDHSVHNTIARAGLDSGLINKWLKVSPLGATPRSWFPSDDMFGWQVAKLWTKQLPDLLARGADDGGIDILTYLKGYNYALRQAAIVPNLAAQFSHKFGHEAFNLSREQAYAMGWRRINTRDADGNAIEGLAGFIDDTQLFPPSIIEQMRMMNRALNYNMRIQNAGWRKVVRAHDTATTVIKSSITLWRPGHHVVNVMGETLMNFLAGVFSPNYYRQAWNIMRSAGELRANTVFGRNPNLSFDELVGEYGLKFGDDGVEVGARADEKLLEVRIGGTTKKITYQSAYQLLDRAGILINYNTAEDLLVEADELVEAGGRISRMFTPIVRANRALGEFSARRDNVFRVAHAMHIMQRRGFASVDDMVDAVRREVYSYHPTMQTLSPFERKYMRRILYFYTWQRQALTKLVEAVIENPGRLTVAPKGVFNASIAMGGEPESIGHPMPNDPRLPGFAARNVLGPHWYNEDGTIGGFTINAPQLDVFQSVFGGMQFSPNLNLFENISASAEGLVRPNTTGLLAPIPKLALELFQGSTFSPTSSREITDWGDHIIDQTGLGYISRITGRNVFNNQGLFGERTDLSTMEPGEQETRSITTFGNALSGLKVTPDWTKWSDIAERERRDQIKAWFTNYSRNILGNPQNVPQPPAGP